MYIFKLYCQFLWHSLMLPLLKCYSCHSSRLAENTRINPAGNTWQCGNKYSTAWHCHSHTYLKTIHDGGLFVRMSAFSQFSGTHGETKKEMTLWHKRSCRSCTWCLLFSQSQWKKGNSSDKVQTLIHEKIRLLMYTTAWVEKELFSFYPFRCPTCTAQPVCTAPDPPPWATYGPQNTATAMERALHQPWAPHMSHWRTILKMKMQRRKSTWSVCVYLCTCKENPSFATGG